VEVLIAANNLSRGMVVAEEHVLLRPWQLDQLPPSYYTDVEQVLGYTVRVDIPQGMPLMPGMLAQNLQAVGQSGSEAALTIPAGKRAYAIPMDLLGGVAWTLEPGDHVDVLASWLLSDVDEEFQSDLPNQYICVGEEEGCQGIFGRMEMLPTGQAVMVYPAAQPQGRYVAQTTIQNTVVLGIGSYQPPTMSGQTVRPADETAETSDPAKARSSSTQALILVVDAQDTLVLKALLELQADIDLALRPAGDEEILPMDPVSIEYLVTRYGVSLPPRLPYRVSPPQTNPLEREVETALEASSASAEGGNE